MVALKTIALRMPIGRVGGAFGAQGAGFSEVNAGTAVNWVAT